MERLKNKFAGSDNPVKTDVPVKETYEWTNKKTGEIHTIPKGIDPGWDYSPGEAAWGRRLSEKTMKQYRSMKADAWENLTPGNWQTFKQPEILPTLKSAALIGPKYTTVASAEKALEKILGDKEKIFSFKAGDFRQDILVNAASLANHIDLNRTPFLPFLPEALTDPQEVWLSFEQHKGSGIVTLRQRIIKMIQMDKKKGMMVVAQAVNGIMEAWTMFPVTKINYVNKQRTGRLLYGKK